ncbi:MAG: lactonase family protein [Chitinophagaceae bacterium]
MKLICGLRFKLVLLLSFVILFLSCKKDQNSYGNSGCLYVLGNQADDNKVKVILRKGDGTIEYYKDFSTGGKGTGAVIGTSSMMTISKDRKWLLVCNPGSDEISVFRINGSDLVLTSTMPLGFKFPNSVTIHGDIVYVLCRGDEGEIIGMRLSSDGKLSKISGGVISIAPKIFPVQISFVNEGKQLLVSDRDQNTLKLFQVDENGLARELSTLISNSPKPYGFSVGKSGFVYMTEAKYGAVSVYKVSDQEIISVMGPLYNYQKAICWSALTHHEKYLYATNADNSTLSSYTIDANHVLHLMSPDGFTNVTSKVPIEMVISKDDLYLYVLCYREQSIQVFDLQNNGIPKFKQELKLYETTCNALSGY